MSIFEESLRSQREIWKEITPRVLALNETQAFLPPRQPKRIILFGIGSSHHAARLSASILSRAKEQLRVPVFAFPSQAIGVEFHPQSGDWAFGFSHRGKTPWTTGALEKFKSAGAWTALVAGQGIGELQTSPMEKCEPHSISVTGAICAVTTLILGRSIAQEWGRISQENDPDLEDCKSRAGKGPQVVLGEWEGEWVAREAALKLMEAARIPVRAYGSEEYLHGPKFCEKKSDLVWTIEASLKTSPLDFIRSLVEMQWLALATAINLGVNPDEPDSR